jgi:hypothetical protein
MGINYNYLLYFKKEALWEALYGLADIADTRGMGETVIHFPDHDQVLPFVTSYGKGNEIHADDAKFEFTISLYFPEDLPIVEYLTERGDNLEDRSPPEEPRRKRYAIGFIYLTVYADLAQHWAFEKPSDLVLFSFGTTGTRMSMLFERSRSIRETFIFLLAQYQGLYGVFDREVDWGELFWYRGEEMSVSLIENYLLPDQLAEFLERGW